MNAQDLKNSILQLAVQGKLVEQRPEEGTAKELLEQIKEEKEKLIKEKKIKKEKPLPEITVDEIPFEIPESWEWVRLNSIVYNSGQCKPENMFCYIDIGSIDNKNQRLSDEDNIIEAENAPSRARKIVKKGDIIYSTVRPYLHNMCIIDREFSHTPIASTGFAVLTCFCGIYNKFLFFYLQSPEFDRYANSTENAKGVAYPAINDDRLYRALIPIPPLTEQKRIVSKIEEILPYIDQYDKAYTKLETFNKKFPEDMKKSILQLAMQGKLVEQRPEEGTADELYKQIVAEKVQLIKDGKIKREKPLPEITEDEIPFEIPSSWKWVRLGTIVSVYGGKRIPAGTRLSEEDTGHKYIRVADMKDGTVSLEDIKYITDEIFQKIKQYYITSDDIYITVAGTIGKVGIVPNELNNANLTENADKLVFSNLDKMFLCRTLNSEVIQHQIREATTQVGQPKLAIARIQKLLIPLPPLAEQKRIVAKIEELLPYCDKLTKN